MKNSKISIIVPIYNSEKYLKECIESLQKQTYSNIEIILVNDGSKDNSLAICQKYQNYDKRIIIIDKINDGVSEARNSGLDIASGDFIMFCDSDDITDEFWCEYMINNFQEDSLLMSNFIRFYGNKSTITSYNSDIKITKFEKNDFIFCYKFAIGSPTTKIFDNDIIQKNKIRFSNKLSLGEDFIFILVYILKLNGYIYYSNKELYYYRQTGDTSLSQTAASVEQSEFLFQATKNIMQEMQVKKSEAWNEFYKITMNNYEKTLYSIALNNNFNFITKYKQLKIAMSNELFKKCNQFCSTNKLFLWFFAHRQSMLFLITISLLNRKN